MKKPDTKIHRILNLFCERASNHADKALLRLLILNEERLPAYSSGFHKAFRTMDVTDNAAMDMAIWHLLHLSDTFWECAALVERSRKR